MKYSKENPPVVCMQTNSSCYKKTITMKPRGVLWHDTDAGNPKISRYVQPLETDSNYEEMMALLGDNPYDNDWNHKDLKKGVNAFIGKLADGTVTSVQTLPWNYAPWGCGSGPKGSLNNTHMQFEICDDGYKSQEYFKAVYQEACELTAYYCQMYNLDPLGSFTYKGVTVPVITSHAESHELGLGNNHGDPLKWLAKYGKSMDDVRHDVAVLMGKVEPAKPSPAPAPAPKTNTLSIRTLSEGCKGEDVKALQILLSGRGCKTDADGIFGPKTKKAVEKYQKKVSLKVDGIAGKDTLSSLMGVA